MRVFIEGATGVRNITSTSRHLGSHSRFHIRAACDEATSARKEKQMRTMHLLEDLEFHKEHPYAQPLLVDKDGRVLRFTLKPGESFKEHNAPNSPFYVVVLKGKGMFSGQDGQEKEFGPNSLLIFDEGENHTVRALDEDLIFVGFLHGVPSNISARVAGLLAHEGEQD
jgi:quercetin dioxygenase-like cupin family protein